MKGKSWLYFALGASTVLSLGAVTNQIIPASPDPLALGDLGITFPDGSTQTTAATAGSEAVPCYCTASAEKGATIALECHRADDDTAFTAIPSGQYLLVSDVIVYSPAGSFRASVGKQNEIDPTGTVPPALDIFGSGTPGTQRSFRAPYIVLATSESLAIKNTGTSQGTVTIHASGFLVSQVTHHL